MFLPRSVGNHVHARLAERALPRQRAPPSFFLGPVAAAGSSRSAALFPRGRFFLSTARPGQAAAAGPLRPPRRIRRRPARLGGASRALDHTPAALISGTSLQPGLLVCRESAPHSIVLFCTCRELKAGMLSLTCKAANLGFRSHLVGDTLPPSIFPGYTATSL